MERVLPFAYDQEVERDLELHEVPRIAARVRPADNYDGAGALLPDQLAQALDYLNFGDHAGDAYEPGFLGGKTRADLFEAFGLADPLMVDDVVVLSLGC